MLRPRTDQYVSVLEDSRRWDRFSFRDGDIVISTPPKSGTTWMQGIVCSLLWPDGQSPDRFGMLSPWLDLRLFDIDEVIEQLEAQDHRRFIKTHSPAPAIPLADNARYVVVYRDGRDALMSWSNHRRALRPEVVEAMNENAAQDGLEPWEPVWNENMDDLFDEWAAWCSPFIHLAGWWPLRHEPFVCFVHYNDLLADLEGEMRRIAAFIGADVADDQWPDAVDRCLLDSMRSDGLAAGSHEMAFDGGAKAFFHQGTNGRWVDVLTPAQLERHATLAATLPPDAAEWLERGSRATGWRPGHDAA